MIKVDGKILNKVNVAKQKVDAKLKKLYRNMTIHEKINTKSRYEYSWTFDPAIPKENVFQIDLERLSRSIIPCDGNDFLQPSKYFKFLS